MLFNVFVRFKTQSGSFCDTPVMRDRQSRRGYFFGWTGTPYPTTFTKRTVGSAVAFAFRCNGVVTVEVRREPDYDARDKGGAGGSAAGYSLDNATCHN